MSWPKLLINEGNRIVNRVSGQNTTPINMQILRFMEMDPSEIKVVILGQDPYPTVGVANGRAFAVSRGSKIPQSLKNIFKEIKEVKGSVSADETLQHWVNQGVLLLNASLSTKIGNSNAHYLEWREYTKKIIMYLDELNPNIKWILWGGFAKKFGRDITGIKICDAHPSPLSVRHRTKHTFVEVNEIDW